MNSKNLVYKLADVSDIDKIVSHEIRHMKEPGYDNLPAHPFYPEYEFDLEKKVSELKNRLETEIGKIRWGRSFVAIDQDLVVGHLNLKGEIETTLHRVKIGMGIEIPYRGLGVGTTLMEMGIKFCRDNKFSYIDLSMFSHNVPAKRLYKKFGFTEEVISKDRFRMYGKSIDDVQMTLKL